MCRFLFSTLCSLFFCDDNDFDADDDDDDVLINNTYMSNDYLNH